MHASPIADGESLAGVQSAPRAVALLSVPWSGPERAARKALLEASERLAGEPGLPAVLCALLDEEAPPVRRWLATLGVPALAGPAPLGAGSVLWLSGGRVVDFAVAGQALGPDEIVAKTRALWQVDGWTRFHEGVACPDPHPPFGHPLPRGEGKTEPATATGKPL